MDLQSDEFLTQKKKFLSEINRIGVDNQSDNDDEDCD